MGEDRKNVLGIVGGVVGIVGGIIGVIIFFSQTVPNLSKQRIAGYINDSPVNEQLQLFFNDHIGKPDVQNQLKTYFLRWSLESKDLLKQNSPWALTPSGQEIVSNAGIPQVYDEFLSNNTDYINYLLGEFVPIFEQPSDEESVAMLDVQSLENLIFLWSTTVVQDYLPEQILNSFENYAADTPDIGISELSLLGGVYLRDSLIEIVRDFNPNLVLTYDKVELKDASTLFNTNEYRRIDLTSNLLGELLKDNTIDWTVPSSAIDELNSFLAP